jgi:hypothetical protein
MFLLRVTGAFNEVGLKYAVVGGYALSLHGVVRGTVDIDFVIPLTEQDFILAEKALRSIGLESKLPVDAKTVFAFREEYIKNKNLIAWSFFNPKLPSEIVDIIITCDLRKMNLVTIDVAGKNVNIVSADELIKMKKNSARPQDVEDVRALEYVKEFK